MPELNEGGAPAQPASFADLRALMSDDAPAEPSTPTKEAPAAEAPADAKNPPPASEPENKQELARDDQGKFAKKPEEAAEPESVQKRIGKAVAKQREAERRAEAAEARLAELSGTGKPGADGKPTEAPQARPRPRQEDFSTYEEYDDALDEWRYEQRQQKQLQSNATEGRKEVQDARMEVFGERYRAAAADPNLQDFSEVMKAAEQLPLSGATMNAIVDSELGPQIMYHLAKNPAEAERIAGLSPVAAVKAIGALEARLEKAGEKAPEPPTPPKVTNAPKPPATVSGTASNADVTTDLSKAKSVSDFRRGYDKALNKG